ncbi:hypothetical protein J3Q64DRAFT_1638131 [Phycomyces blakesleeanus]|uniref:Galactose oxidase n=1 Tax=Phycomyces blakesleeanus TaxID=4837 RepID=A0ABR3B418_PHYBL
MIDNRQWARVRVDGVGPGERAGHSSVVLNGIIYVWGGQRKGKYLDDLYAINMTEYPHNLQWKLISPRNEGPMPRAGHVSVISGNEMYIFGGTDSERLYQDIWTFHLAEQCWSKIPAVGYIPAAREYAACALIDDLIYVFGGKGRDGVKLGDLCAFRIKGYRWYMFQNMGPAPSPRHSLTMTAIKEKIYVVGGEFAGKPEDSLMIHALDSCKYRKEIYKNKNVKKEEEEEDEEQEVSDHSISTKTTEQVPIKLSDLSDPFHNDRVLLLRELRSRDEMIKDMKKKEQWWKAEVTLARKARSSKGDFEDEKCNGDTDLMSIGDKDSKMAKLFNQLVSVKSELRRVRASIVQQALPASQKLEQADRMRIMALQEAAYYRSKYVAMKERQEEELAKIETERAEKLESRLSAALKENQSNSKILQQLQKRAQFDHTARIAAEERVKEAHERAEDAQKAHQAALEKLSDMYTSSLQTEMHLRNSSLRITELTNRLSEALAHRSASDELSEAAITISRLESTNIRTRNETASLKQNLAESMDDIARLRILLSEREEALNEANRQLEDSTIQLNMMKDAMSHGGRISTSDNAHTSTTKGH